MVHASDLKNGSIVEIDGDSYVVEQLQIQTPSARGGASIYKLRFRNLRTRHKLDQAVKGDAQYKDVDLRRKEVQFLYREQDSYTFMDLEDYSQFELREADLEDAKPFLIEDLEGIAALIVDDHPIAIEMPPCVNMKIEACDPSIRGASATARTKPATMATGLIVQVPEYLSAEEVIKVDTRTGKFLSRA